MKETLRQLVELQNLENTLRGLTEMKEKQVRLDAENAETLQFFETMLSERETAINEVQAFCKAKAAEIEEAESNARRARSRLGQIKSQRELTALNKELESARRTNLAKSEELKKLNDQLEAATTDYEQKKNEHATLVEAMNDTKASLLAAIEQGEVDAHDHRARQAQIKESLDRPLLSRFERILRGRGGQAVVVMDSNTCTACRMTVSPQVYIRLQRMETVENCDSCKRLLVFRRVITGEAEDASA